MKKYKAKKGLSREKAKTMLKDDQAQGHKLTPKQKRYFGYVAGGGKPKAQDGLINSGQPTPQGQPPQQAQPQPQQGGVSVDVTMIATMNGQQQPLGNMKISSPDDLKKLVQTIVQVFQQGQQSGQQSGQPAPGGQPPAPQPQGQPTQQ